MKLISLNTWSGRAGSEGLLDFFRRHKDVDVFCLQEIWEGGHDHTKQWGPNINSNLITDIGIILKDHQVFFRPHFYDFWGLAIFAKKDLKIQEEGDIFVFRNREDAHEEFNPHHARNLQYMKIEMAAGPRVIANFHGIWDGVSKEDTKERLTQSENILNFFKSISDPYVFAGDFNLLPEGKSLQKFEEFGMRNLIKEFGVTSTRSSHYKKPVKFADYTFVSEGITVNDFKVLPDEVSDHLAMYLDFE